MAIRVVEFFQVERTKLERFLNNNQQIGYKIHPAMAVRVVEFSNGGYKIKKLFA
jgi:hypothetical protein